MHRLNAIIRNLRNTSHFKTMATTPNNSKVHVRILNLVSKQIMMMYPDWNASLVL